MREIKFRAWDNKKMYYEINLFSCSEDNLHEMYFCCFTPKQEMFYPSGKEVFMQFTGLKDKNGKEIYESDKVKYMDMIGEIKWRDFRWHFFNKDGFCSDIMKGEDFEVIGNIYEK